LIAACGSGRSTSFIPAVPAAWSVTTIAFIVRLLACGMSSSSEFPCRRENATAKLDGPMISGYEFDAIDVAANVPTSRSKNANESDPLPVVDPLMVKPAQAGPRSLGRHRRKR
jgi:hypothetical protein